MKTIYKILIFTLISNNIFAQVNITRQVIGSSGNVQSNTNLSLSFTVGESIVTTQSSNPAYIILTQGFQQPSNVATLSVQLTIYPVSCNGYNDGEIFGIINGCAPPYEISLDGVISRYDTTSTDSFRFKNLLQGEYILKITGITGCTISDTLSININLDNDCDLHIFSGITPNNDGNNDKWIIKNVALFQPNNVYIYNRWGDLVWSADNYDNETIVWEGKSNKGENLPDGTYFYIFKTDNKTYKGWIELTR